MDIAAKSQFFVQYVDFDFDFELPMKHIYREKLHFNINVSLMFKSA